MAAKEGTLTGAMVLVGWCGGVVGDQGAGGKLRMPLARLEKEIEDEQIERMNCSR